MTTGQAAVLTAYGQPVELREIVVPDPEPGAVIARVLRSTVCGTDLHIAEGRLSFASRLPAILGHEIVAEVLDVNGRGTDSVGQPLQVGDVVAWAYAWCGSCYWCAAARQPTLCPNARRYGWGPADEFPYLTGGFAEYVYVTPRCKIVKVPDGLDPSLAAAATCSLRTAVHGFERLGGIAPGESVVIQGSGPVGLWATAYAAASGAGSVITIGAPADRLALARAWGATHVFDVEATTARLRREAILDVTEGRGADAVLECSGAPTAIGEGLELPRPGGRYAIIGQSSDDDITIRGAVFVSNHLTVVGVRGGDIGHYHRALRFVADHQHRLPLGALIGSSYSLTEVDDALDSMRRMQEMKPVIVPAGVCGDINPGEEVTLRAR